MHDVCSDFCYRVVCFRHGSAIVRELLFPEQNELCVDFSRCLRLWLPGRYEFLGGRFAKLICLWLMVQLRVASLNNGYVDA